MNNVLKNSAVIVGEPTGPTCRTCPSWIPVEEKEGGECRYNPAQMIAVPTMVETLQGPRSMMAVQSFYPQTLGHHFCMRHPELSAALALRHVRIVFGALAEENPQVAAVFESAGLGDLVPKHSPAKGTPS